MPPSQCTAGLVRAKVGVPKLHAEGMGGHGLVSAVAVAGASSVWLKFSRSVHQPIPSPHLCTCGSTHVCKVGFNAASHLGLKPKI